MQKKVPYVAQLGNMDCSIACMTMLFRYYGLDVDIVDVGQVVHIGRDGVNLTQLKQATQQFGFKCTAYRYNKQKNILDSNLPAVVYSGSHLAVIGSKTVLGQYILLDPIKGKSIVNFEQIHDTFSDILITIRPEKRIKRKKCKPKLKVAINYKLVAGIISLMLLIQALTLSIPLVEQALIDSITQSQSLLNSAYILVGCIVIAGLYFFLSIARQKLMLRLDISFVKEIMTKMLKKLFDIDPSFFEWHAVGEIVNRFTDSNLNHTGIYLYSKGKIMIHLTFDYKTDEKCTTPGQYLKYHRTFQGLSTRELAEKVGIVPATLVLYENDRHPIKHSTAVALANALGIDRNRLLDKYTAFVDYPYSSLLKKVRQDLSLTQIQMAELIGIGQTSYSGWEREIRVPRRKEYDKILAALEKLRVNVDTYLCQSASI